MTGKAKTYLRVKHEKNSKCDFHSMFTFIRFIAFLIFHPNIRFHFHSHYCFFPSGSGAVAFPCFQFSSTFGTFFSVYAGSVLWIKFFKSYRHNLQTTSKIWKSLLFFFFILYPSTFVSLLLCSFIINDSSII